MVRNFIGALPSMIIAVDFIVNNQHKMIYKNVIFKEFGIKLKLRIYTSIVERRSKT